MQYGLHRPNGRLSTSKLANWSKELRSTRAHQLEVGGRHQKLKALLLKSFNFVRCAGRATQDLAMLLSRSGYFGYCFVELPLVLPAAQAKGERKVACANEKNIHARGRRNLIDV